MTDIIAIEALNKTIPTNSLGMPDGIYRPDLLPPSNVLSHIPSLRTQIPKNSLPPSADSSTPPLDEEGIAGQLTIVTEQTLISQAESEVSAAFIPLSYDEGFPTLDGIPFWVQLPFEPNTAFEAFKLYVSQGASRQLFLLTEDASLPSGISMTQLKELSVLYYWSHRARSHDLFYAVHRKHERAQRAMETENDHFLLATRLANIIDVYLNEQGEEFAELLTPSAVMDLIKLQTQLSRISVGLPMNGVSPSAAHQDSVEGLSTRQVSQMLVDKVKSEHTDEGEATQNSDGNTYNQTLIQVLNDPEMLEMAQDLVIKMTGGQPDKDFGDRSDLHASTKEAEKTQR